jgi:6,7-dimethyl-8-ribityllumazine synthase
MTAHHRPDAAPAVDGTELRVAVIRARWNTEIIDRLAVGVAYALDRAGVVHRSDLTVAGSLELPFAAKVVAEAGDVDAIVCLGTVVRGETTHYDLVANGCATGLQRVQLDTGVPIGFGVLTVEDLDQARARSEVPPGPNAGADATDAALELAALVRTLAGVPG